MKIGYLLSNEESPPNDLVRYARATEEGEEVLPAEKG
jgi:hypothetical protein